MKMRVLFCITLMMFYPMSWAGKKVVFALPSVRDDPFWDVVLRGCNDAAKAFDVDLKVLRYSPINVDDEMNSIDIALSKPSDATIMVLYHQTPQLLRALEESSSHNHLIQIINSGESVLAKSDMKANFIGMNDYTAGFVMGEKLSKLAIRKVLLLSHLPDDNMVVISREAGLQAALPNAKVVLIDCSGLDDSDTKKCIRKGLDKEKDADTVVALGPLIFNHFAKVVDLDEKENVSYNMASFDLTQYLATTLKQGKLLFVIDQQPYLQGFYAVADSALFADHKLHLSSSVVTGPSVVYPQDVDEIFDKIGTTR